MKREFIRAYSRKVTNRGVVAFVAVALVDLGARTAYAAPATCSVPGSNTTLSAPCTDSWVGFFPLLGDLEMGPSSVSIPGASVSTTFNLSEVSISSNLEQGQSDFRDIFTISGGSGTGTAIFLWSLTGTLQQFAPPPNCDPFLDGSNLIFSSVTVGLAASFMPLCSEGTRPINLTGSFAVPFTYGVPFIEGLRLYGQAVNGLADGLRGRFTSIILPSGATLTTGSGTEYPIQTTSGFCGSDPPSEGTVAFCVPFDPNAQQPVTHRVDYPGGHSFKVIGTVRQPFYLQIVSVPISWPGPTSRFPDGSEVCVPYVFATPTSAGSCSRYDVTPFDATGPGGTPGNPIPPADEHLYFSFPIHVRVAWDHPTLTEFGGTGILQTYDNPRGLRCPPPTSDTSPCYDRTDAVLPNLQSGQDPGDDMSADGMSQYFIVQQPHANDLVGCMEPLDCTRPTDPTANVFEAGRTIPIKVVLSPSNPQADLRLSFTDPGGTPHTAESEGNSNEGNMFRHTGNHFQFNWSTRGLAPGVYTITISPGFNFGSLFAPTSILVTLR